MSRSAPSKSLGRSRFNPRPFDLRYSEFERLAVILTAYSPGRLTNGYERDQ
jgi:hypothetical protein